MCVCMCVYMYMYMYMYIYIYISKEPAQTGSKLCPYILSNKDFRAKLLSSWGNSSRSENFLPHDPRIFLLVIQGKEQGEVISGHQAVWEHTVRGKQITLTTHVPINPNSRTEKWKWKELSQGGNLVTEEAPHACYLYGHNASKK